MLKNNIAKNCYSKIVTNSQNSTDNSTDNQNVISILVLFVSDNLQTQQLTATQTQDGLIAVKDELLNVFTVTEKTFWKKTLNTSHSTDVNAITNYLLKDSIMILVFAKLW